MSDYVVSAVMLGAEGIEVSFMVLPDDVRNKGSFVRTRGYLITDVGPYAAEVAELREAILAFVKDVDEDWGAAPIHLEALAQPLGDTEDDDDKGMGE